MAEPVCRGHLREGWDEAKAVISSVTTFAQEQLFRAVLPFAEANLSTKRVREREKESVCVCVCVFVCVLCACVSPGTGRHQGRRPACHLFATGLLSLLREN